MDYGDLILFPVFLIILSLFFRARRNTYTDALLRKYHRQGFWLKIFSCIAFIIYNVYFYPADSIGLYQKEGANIYHLILQNSNHLKWLFQKGKYFDESFLDLAKKLGVRHIVFHPLTFRSFDSKGMKVYFDRLARLQEQYNITVMLENMPNDMAYAKLHDSSEDHTRHHLEKIKTIADIYGFLLTYDVSHAELIRPSENDVFRSLFPRIGNIHASSFVHHTHHLPFTMGDFDIQNFLQYLSKEKYKGLFTLEVYYPKLRLMRNTYDFTAIADSVAIVKKLLGK